MKIVGVVCSPRVNGNTEILVAEVLAGATDEGADVELIPIFGKSISPCDSCLSCMKTGQCHIKDDTQEIYKKFEEADGIVLGSPVYFFNVSAQAKILIDRTYALTWSRKLAGKVGGAVAVARRAGTGNVMSFLYTVFTLHRMVIAGGTVGYEGEDSPYGEKEAIKLDQRAMREARAVGKNIVRMVNRLSK